MFYIRLVAKPKCEQNLPSDFEVLCSTLKRRRKSQIVRASIIVSSDQLLALKLLSRGFIIGEITMGLMM